MWFINCILPMIAVLPLYLISVAISMSPKKQEHLKELAESKGHVVTAKLIKENRKVYEDEGKPWIHRVYAIYQYEVKGRKYKYRASCDIPDRYVTLYYMKKPRHAAEKGNISSEKINWGLLYVLLILINFLLFPNL